MGFCAYKSLNMPSYNKEMNVNAETFKVWKDRKNVVLPHP